MYDQQHPWWSNEGIVKTTTFQKGCRNDSCFLWIPPDLETLRSFQNQIAAIQRDAVWWLHTVVPSISKVGAKDYVHWWAASTSQQQQRSRCRGSTVLATAGY